MIVGLIDLDRRRWFDGLENTVVAAQVYQRLAFVRQLVAGHHLGLDFSAGLGALADDALDRHLLHLDLLHRGCDVPREVLERDRIAFGIDEIPGV